MFARLITAAILLAASAALAQGPPQTSEPEVDTAEVLRWGDRVVVAGEGPRAGGEALYSEAMATPVDDSDQFFVTVWGHSRCEACRQLHQAFQSDPHLAAFVADPPGERRPWAHFNYYQADNAQQAWRFARHKIPVRGPFPIVTIQPPLNGHYGNPQTVIDRIDAAQLGKPQDLAKRIQASVRLYLSKVQRPANLAAKVDRPGGHEGEDGVLPPGHPLVEQVGDDVSFPWGPEAPPAQPTFDPIFPQGGPAAPQPATLAQLQQACPGCPPEFLLEQLTAKATLEQAQLAWLRAQVKPKPQEPVPSVEPVKVEPVTRVPVAPTFNLWAMLTNLVSGLGGATIFALVFRGWAVYRRVKAARGESLLVSDDVFQFLSGLATQPPINQAR